MNPHLTLHGAGVVLCFLGMLLCLWGQTGARSTNGKATTPGLIGLAVLVLGGVVTLAPMIV